MTTGKPSRDNPSGSIGTTIIFENDLVRVWSIDVEEGGNKAWHHHRLPYVIVPIGDGRIELETRDGTIMQIEDKSGAAIWRDAGEIHELRNRGQGTYRNVLIEIKPQTAAQ